MKSGTAAWWCDKYWEVGIPKPNVIKMIQDESFQAGRISGLREGAELLKLICSNFRHINTMSTDGPCRKDVCSYCSSSKELEREATALEKEGEVK